LAWRQAIIASVKEEIQVEQKILYDVFRREIRDHKIPLSLGKTCPVKCTFCYEKDISYRPTFDVPLTTQEDWEYILEQVKQYPTRPEESWLLGGNEYMEWTDIFLHPKALGWMEEFLDTTDKNVMFFTVGFLPPKKINYLVKKYPGRINFELSVITLGKHRKGLMPHGPSIKQVLEILDGPAVASANFYSFGPDTMSTDATTISKINRKCVLWMGCMTPLKWIDKDTTALMRQGKKALPDEARKIYSANLPNTTMIHTESYITAFLSREKILKVFDASEIEKKDSVVLSGNVYRLLNLFRKNRSKFLYVPNDTLGGDSDCATLLTFSDISKRLTDQTRVWLPKVILESSSKEEKDISGVYFDEFKAKYPRIRFKVLHKVNSHLSNRKLYEKGFIKNYVEDYLDNPLSRKFEAEALPS